MEWKDEMLKRGWSEFFRGSNRHFMSFLAVVFQAAMNDGLMIQMALHRERNDVTGDIHRGFDSHQRHIAGILAIKWW